jgi:hypothetical protein
LKAGSTVGRFTMAWRWGLTGVARWRMWGGGSARPSSGRKKGHRPPGGLVGPHGLRRPTVRLGQLGQMPGKEFVWI